MACHFVYNDSCCTSIEPSPVGMTHMFSIQALWGSLLIAAAPTSTRLSPPLLFTSRSGYKSSSLIGLACFWLQHSRCCHGFDWHSCWSLFFLLPTFICRMCPMAGKWYNSPHFLTRGQKTSSCLWTLYSHTLKRLKSKILVRDWTYLINLNNKYCSVN